MVAVAVISGLLALLVIIYLLALCPGRPRREKLRPFLGKCVAHRGLFNNRDVPENSLSAFANSVEKGFPIELDVQLTKDGELVVFHDELLDRMCKTDKKVADYTYSDLKSLTLLKTEERIPKFTEVLRLVDGRVPLLIEVKHYADHIKTAKALASVMKGYKGEYAVQSFHPRIVAWFRRHEKDVARGLLVTKYEKKGSHLPWHTVCSTLLLNFYSRPDFVSYNHKYTKLFPYRIARKLYRFEAACWTLKSREELECAKKQFNIYIFDSFLPK